MSRPLSIVIPSHRRADLLTLCLRSVEVCRPNDCEVIVVDDGSKRALISETASRFQGVRVVRLPKARGFAVAANAGIAIATGDVVELLNDDTEVTPGWAATALGRFTDPAVVAVAPLVLMHPATAGTGHPLVDSAGDEYDPGGFARKRGHGERLNETHLRPGEVGSVSASAGFYRRSALVRAGGFAELFGAYFEDVDLSLRLRSAGGGIEYEPRSVVWHRVSSSYGRALTRIALERQSCNEERLFWKHTPSPLRLVSFPRHLAVLAGKMGRRIAENQLAAWVTGRLRYAWLAR